MAGTESVRTDRQLWVLAIWVQAMTKLQSSTAIIQLNRRTKCPAIGYSISPKTSEVLVICLNLTTEPPAVTVGTTAG